MLCDGVPLLMTLLVRVLLAKAPKAPSSPSAGGSSPPSAGGSSPPSFGGSPGMERRRSFIKLNCCWGYSACKIFDRNTRTETLQRYKLRP